MADDIKIEDVLSHIAGDNPGDDKNVSPQAYANLEAHPEFNDIFSQFGDIFGDVFGGKREPGRGADLRVELGVTFEEGWSGTEKNVPVSIGMNCGTCEGTGDLDQTSKSSPCTACSGSGYTQQTSGFFSIKSACSTCSGRGSIPRQRCGSCGGRGRTKRDTAFKVRVPARVVDGTLLRLRGRGDEPSLEGAEPGDVYIYIKVLPHERYRRANLNLLVDHPLSQERARRGGQIQVPLPESQHAVSLDPGVKDGEELVLNGKGFIDTKTGDRGDVIIRYRVKRRSVLAKLFGRKSDPEQG